MTTLAITGPWPPLRGRVCAPGAKNSAMPVLVAAALAPGSVEVRELPRLSDIETLAAILRHLGSDLTVAGGIARAGPARVTCPDVPPELSARLRGSVYALALPAVLLGRATSGPIGGDRLSGPSSRRDRLLPHARAFAGMGMTLRAGRHGWEVLGGPPRPGEFSVDDDGVSASALAALLAAAAQGRTVVRGASLEIEVDDTMAALAALGARVERDGRTLVVEGPLAAGPATVVLPGDRIHAGTVAIAAAVTGGSVELPASVAGRMAATFEALASFGVEISRGRDGDVRVAGPAVRPAAVATAMYPGFATDLLPPLTVLAAQAPGRSTLDERVYDSRDGHVPGLRRLGARIVGGGPRLVVEGPAAWRAAAVEGAGIRETAALVLAAVAAPGTTRIGNAGALRRGYEDLTGSLRRLRASGGRAGGSSDDLHDEQHPRRPLRGAPG